LLATTLAKLAGEQGRWETDIKIR